MALFTENEVDALESAVSDAMGYVRWVQYLHTGYFNRLIETCHSHPDAAREMFSSLFDEHFDGVQWAQKWLHRESPFRWMLMEGYLSPTFFLNGPKLARRFCDYFEGLRNQSLVDQLNFGFKPVSASYLFSTRGGGMLGDQSVIRVLDRVCREAIGLIPLTNALARLSPGSIDSDIGPAFDDLRQVVRDYLIPLHHAPFINEVGNDRGYAGDLNGRVKYELAKLRSISLGAANSFPPLPSVDEWLVAEEFRNIVATSAFAWLSQDCRHSEDFRSVKWFDETFEFTNMQAIVVEMLWKAAEDATPALSETFLLERAGSDGSRLRDLFRSSGIPHPAWETLIVPGEKSGTRKLSPKSQNPG